MKKKYKNTILAMFISTISLTNIASAEGTTENKGTKSLLTIENPSPMVLENCNNILSQMTDEKVKVSEMEKCTFFLEQKFKTMQLENELKTIKHDEKIIADFKVIDVKTFSVLTETMKNLRKAMLLPEGKTQEFDRVAVLYKNPEIELKEKEKEAASYYKRFGEDNYKTTKEIYEAFKLLNNNLVKQKEHVLEVEKYISGATFEKEAKKFNKSFDKELVINQAILKDYNTFITARSLEAKNALNKIVEGKKITLTKNECSLLDTMYKGYELKSFKNLKCK